MRGLCGVDVIPDTPDVAEIQYVVLYSAWLIGWLTGGHPIPGGRTRALFSVPSTLFLWPF